jgi:hypothetical protein
MVTVFCSVKKSIEYRPPSRPTPLALTPSVATVRCPADTTRVRSCAHESSHTHTHCHLTHSPPNGTRRSRTSQQLTHTVPASMRRATRCARPSDDVHTVRRCECKYPPPPPPHLALACAQHTTPNAPDDASPYGMSSANAIASSSVSNGVTVTTGPNISSCARTHITSQAYSLRHAPALCATSASSRR